MHAHLGTLLYLKNTKKKKQLQILQNKVVRFILDVGPRTHIGQNELDKVGMLSCKDRIVQLKLNHVFKIFNDTCPHYLKFDFTRVSSLHKYNTRGSPFNFVVPLVKGQAKFTFFFYILSNEIKSISDFNLFKKLVKKHLVDLTSIGY